MLEVGIITISDKLLKEGGINIPEQEVKMYLEQKGWSAKYTNIVSGNKTDIRNELLKCSDEMNFPLVITIGGAGYGPDSFVPEVTLEIIDREVRGIHEKMRSISSQYNPNGWLTRGVAGLHNKTLIVNLPGSAKAAKENLEIGYDVIKHVIDMVWPTEDFLTKGC